MIQHWITEKFTSHQYFDGYIETFVSDPLGLVATVFSGNLSDLEFRANTPAKSIDYSGYFSDATSYSISPAVESGWSFNTSTGVLTVEESTVDTFGSYVITGANAGGSDSSNAFYVKVIAGLVSGNYGGRTLRALSEYEDEIREILDLEEKEKEKELKKLEKKETKLEAKTPKTDAARQKLKASLELVSKSLLQIERDLTVITEKRAQISLKARILKDDDDVIAIIIAKGWL